MYYKYGHEPNKQNGFSLPAAIFILVIMALLAAAVISLFAKGTKGVSQEVLSTRAFYSAESGAQYVLGQLFSLTGGAANCSGAYTINYNTNGMAGCSSRMACSSVTIGTDVYYNITSTGACNSGSDRTERRIELKARAQ